MKAAPATLLSSANVSFDTHITIYSGTTLGHFFFDGFPYPLVWFRKLCLQILRLAFNTVRCLRSFDQSCRHLRLNVADFVHILSSFTLTLIKLTRLFEIKIVFCYSILS